VLRARGLGKAAAIGFASEGAHTVICARGKKALLAAVKEIRRAAYDRTTTVLPLAADLMDSKDIRHLVATTVKRYGRDRHPGDQCRGTSRRRLPGTRRRDMECGHHPQSDELRSGCIREVLPHMQKRQWGRIINITSLAAKQPVNDLVISSAVRPGILVCRKSWRTNTAPTE